MLSNISIFPSSLYSYFSQKKEANDAPFDKLKNLQELADTLKSEDCDFNQWKAWKSEIQAFISKHSDDPEQLDVFIESITNWGMERNPQKIMAMITDIISLEILTRTVNFKQMNSDHSFTDIFDLAAENATSFPEPTDDSLTSRLNVEWKRFRPIILYFIPNVLNIFLGAFNFLDSQKKFTTLWEKHLLVEIVYKFCIIPYCLIQLLQPIFVVTAKVYLVAGLIIVATGLLISCYQRWFRPLPDEIVNCTNLDKQMEKGVIDVKVGQAEEIDRLIAALEVDSTNVLLIGLSGEGKTALIHHFIQLKHEGKLPDRLQPLTVHEVDCGLMISNVSYGHSELINQTREQIEGHEEEVLFFFDEFYQLVLNKGAFQTFKKKFLEDKPHCKCVLAVTCKEWEEIKKLDSDYSFRRRVFRIKMESASDTQIRKIIENMQHRFAQDVPVTEDAIEAIINVSAIEDYLPEIGRAAKAEEIFKTAVRLCRAAYNHHYGDADLDENQIELTRKQIHKIKKIIAHQQKLKTDYYRLSHLFSKAVAPKDSDYFEDEDIDMSCLEDVDILDDDDYHHNKKKSSAPLLSKDSFSEKEQIMYLWYCFYALNSIEEILKREIEKVDKDIPIQVNFDLVDHVYNEIRSMEESENE